MIKTEALQGEIDQSLSYINAQQEDLSSILDAYEKQMKEVLDQSNLQQPMQPADVQREKAYTLAESLNKQLDDVSRNLNIMIEEVNKMNGDEQSVDDNESEDNVREIISFRYPFIVIFLFYTDNFQCRSHKSSKFLMLTLHPYNGLIVPLPLCKIRCKKLISYKKRLRGTKLCYEDE